MPVKIINYEIVNTPKGCGITFFHDTEIPVNLGQALLHFQLIDGDMHIYDEGNTYFIFTSASKSRSIQANDELTLIGIEPETGSITIDLDCSFQERH